MSRMTRRQKPKVYPLPLQNPKNATTLGFFFSMHVEKIVTRLMISNYCCRK